MAAELASSMARIAARRASKEIFIQQSSGVGSTTHPLEFEIALSG
jgi:hypothetical protein